MAMSRKNFERTAAILKIQVNKAWESGGGLARLSEIGEIANALADSFQEDNPRFDRERFLAACGL